MAITDAEVIKFVNEQIRPIAEKRRNVYYQEKAILLEWFNTISANCPNDAGEILQDGREAEGVTQLSGADINNLITQLSNDVTACELAGVLNVIEKPCVRPLGV